jgi:hypothetical protein
MMTSEWRMADDDIGVKAARLSLFTRHHLASALPLSAMMLD